MNLVGCRLVLSLVACVAITSSGEVRGESRTSPDTDPNQNIALGKQVQYAPQPDYRLTAKGDTDSTDLTDGVLSDHPRGHLWFDSKCVGWSYAGRCNLVVDLGDVYPVDEVAIRIQGGSPQHGICTPSWIEVMVSDDGKQYRLVGEYSTFRPGENQRFGVPPHAGEAWVHRFTFAVLHTRARFVGLRLSMAGLTVADELVVLRGHHDPMALDMEQWSPTDFSVHRPQMYFHKPYLCFTTNVATPNPVGLVMPPAADAEAVTVLLDLPTGTHLVAGTLGGTDLTGLEGTPTEGGDYLRYEFPATAEKTAKSWGRLFIGGDWQHGETGELRYRLAYPTGDATPLMTVPLQAIQIPPTPQPERLMASLGWYGLQDVQRWPGGLEALRTLGMNTISSFVHWMRDEALWNVWEQASEQGFRRLNIDSTFHRMTQTDEIFCQFADGTHGTKLCPSYRGQYYQAEVRRVAEQCARAKPDYLFGDIEVWGWRGPTDAQKCERCLADFEETDSDDWEAWTLQKGYEMWTQVTNTVRRMVTENGGAEPEFGVYDWRAGKHYQYTWPFDRLYPDYLQSSQVSTYTPLYPHHLILVGDECREDRKHLPRSDVIPWITPGDAGTFSGESFRYALLECFANGARGVSFWSGRLWDAELLAAYARVVRSLAPVEELIIAGELLTGADVQEPARLSGITHGSEMLVLVADYLRPAPTEVTIRLPVKTVCAVMDLDSGEELGSVEPGETLVVPLLGDRARLLHVRH